MVLKVFGECWTRWAAVIRHVSAEYDFPASSKEELNFFFRMFAGDGNTFRTRSKNWKFVVDVTRRGDIIVDIIVDIIAFTLTAKPTEDPRCNGAVITRACDIHADPEGEEYVGAPELRWITVTSGGMSYQHCCDKECSGPNKAYGTPRLSWETTRLKIVQKAYEQEVLALREQTDEQSQKQVTALRQLVEEVSDELDKERESKKKWGKAARKKQQEHTGILEATASMREGMHKRGDVIEEAIETKEAAFIEERERIENATLQSEAELRSLREVNDNMRAENEAMEKRFRNLKKANRELEKGQETDKDNLQALQNMNIGLKEKVKYLESKNTDANNESLREIKGLSVELKSLEQNIQLLKSEHEKDTVMLQEKFHSLNDSNLKLETGKKSANHYITNLEAKIKSMEAEAKHSGTVIAKLEAEAQLKTDDTCHLKASLEKAQKELREKFMKYADDKAKSKHEMREKDEYTQRLQNELRHSQTTVINMRRYQTNQQHSAPTASGQIPGLNFANELENQRRISREAHERADDLESKLDATQMELRAKGAETNALKQKMTEKASRIIDLEKKCVDYASKIAALRAEVESAMAEVKELQKTFAEKTSAANQEIETGKKQLQELDKRCAEKVAAAIKLEKQCKDNENYTANLEKKLEELRGTMESVLGEVSIHQGRKRRRTEGPDLQL